MGNPRIVPLLFALAISGLGMACDRQGESPSSSSSSAELVEVRTQYALPKSVRRQLYVGRDADAGIADPGEPFNRSDAIENEKWPSSRLVVAGRRGDSWIVAMERGGFAYEVEVLWFESSEAPAWRIQRLDRPPRSYRDLLAWLPAVGGGDAAPPTLPPLPRPDSATAAVADLSRRVRRLAGPSLLECGVWLGGDGTVPAGALSQAITCGRSAAAKRQSFWIAVHAPGGVSFHELNAHGLFAGTDGVIHRFTYRVDLPVSDGPGPEFAIARCAEPTDATPSGNFRCLESAGALTIP